MPNVLTEKTYKYYDSISRYINFPYYYHLIDNKYVYGTTKNIKKDIPYTSHVVKKNDTLDSLSLYYYNNPTYFWMIANFNDIQDPFCDLNEGDILRIPQFSSIVFEDPRS